MDLKRQNSKIEELQIGQLLRLNSGLGSGKSFQEFLSGEPYYFAVDGTLSQDQQIDVLVFYAGSFGYFGRLQTEQDKERLLDGLESATGGKGSFKRAQADKIISSLGKRVFLLHNVHEKAPQIFNTRWAMETLQNLYSKVDQLNIVGGGAKSNIWCQIFADITNRTINRVSDPQQAGAKGVALLASMSLGYINSFEDIKKYIKINRSFYPNLEYRDLYDKLFIEFKNIYRQNKKWYARMNHHRS